MPRFTTCVAIVLAAVVVAGCTDPVSPSGPPPTSSVPEPTPTQARPLARTVMPEDPTTIVPGKTAAEIALATSKALYNKAPAVVLLDETDEDGFADASTVAADLGVPVLLTSEAANAGEKLRDELTRLEPETIVSVGEQATKWAQTASSAPAAPVEVVPFGTGDSRLPAVTPAAPLDQLLVLALNQKASRAAIATARASGARVLLLNDADPRTSNDAIKALSDQSTERVLALGAAFGSAERLRRRIDTAATGVLLPGGGQVLFPGRRMVALYGHPGSSVLGSLGEQSVSAAIARAKRVAASYSALVKEPVIPTFEIIATVAAAGAGSDGNYSNESSIAHLRPWVDAAKKAGVYVVLDLQPGRTDFLTQAKRYEVLLREPHVGLALDPEWRLKPDEIHMVQIGSVSADEINKTSAWLAALTREHKLPQKVLMLHQFRLDMITNRANVVTSHDELKIIIHADGFGTTPQKFNTWRAMHINPPANVWWGWKNFYDEDRPTFTPSQTVAVKPSPVFVSYQ